MEQKDFFISYNKADRLWAEWIAWQLEEAGYSTWLQEWDFRPGSNFVLKMDEALQQTKRLIAVLSPDYIKALFTQPEWAAIFRRDPTGKGNLLIPVRVRECDPPGLLTTIVRVDLVGLENDEEKCRKALLQGVRRGRNKPSHAPRFPGTDKPSFPPSVRPNQPTFSNKQNKLLAIRKNKAMPISQHRANNSSMKRLIPRPQKASNFHNMPARNPQPILNSEDIGGDVVKPMPIGAFLIRNNSKQLTGIDVAIPATRVSSFRLSTFILVALAILVVVMLVITIAFLVTNPFPSQHPDLLFFPNNSIQATPSPSQRLKVLSQKDRNQYSSTPEYNTWADYDSSAAAMAEVINAYGHQYHIWNILEVEIQMHEITPDQGLKDANGITMTVAYFGFKATSLGNLLTLDQIIDKANHGQPVIVSFPPSDYFPGGHSVVVIGGSPNAVEIVDSNNPNQHTYALQQFMKYWGGSRGFSAIVIPK